MDTICLMEVDNGGKLDTWPQQQSGQDLVIEEVQRGEESNFPKAHLPTSESYGHATNPTKEKHTTRWKRKARGTAHLNSILTDITNSSIHVGAKRGSTIPKQDISPPRKKGKIRVC